MSSDIAAEFDRLSQWHQSLNNTKQDRLSAISLYSHQFPTDSVYEDSDPESQLSDSTSSQDSDHASSPATSHSSEESRAEQQELSLTSQVSYGKLANAESLLETQTSTETSQVTYQVPYRLKPNPHEQAHPHTLAGSQQAVHSSSSNESTPTPQHPRRGRLANVVAPPALRRDTDATDGIVHMIVFFCTNLINSIWCTNSQVATTTPTMQQNSTVLPLRVFITETLRRSKTSYSTLQIALYYLILLKQCLPAQTAADKSGCRAMQCGRRMFLTSLILASKYLQDRNYSARAWSKISGLPLKEINDNERRFLSIVNWDLHVPKCTFENWSKIVLQVCRKSQDMDSICKRPGPGPTAPNFLPSMDQSTWWLINLRQLKTDVVKCVIKTQQYVESVCPFKQKTPFSRPIPNQSGLSEECVESFADVLVEDHTTARNTPLGPSPKQFEPVSDLLHPAAPLTMPPQPTLRNLPTPQSTPQSNVQCYWTPRLSHQNSNSSLRCRPSASALGSAFKRHCPIANLESCPPPPPRTCDRVQLPRPRLNTSFSTSTSVVSSPESTTSDAFSAVSRSRSSSISSNSSWATSSSHNFDSQWLVSNPSNAPSLACSGQPPVTWCAPSADQMIEHGRAASTLPQNLQVNCEQASRRRQEVAQILAGLRVDESVVRSRARPVLTRSTTRIYKPCEESTKTQQLKRSRSDTFATVPTTPESSWTPVQATPQAMQSHYDQCASASQHAVELNKCYKRVQQPTQCWAQPRKPLQTGSQNCKRRALQIPQVSPAVERARYLLQPDVAGSFCA